MALETLRGIKEIGGFEVERMIAEKGAWEINFGEKYIYTASDNSIHFKIQDGPIKEHGVNGCQAITILEAMRIMYLQLNKKIPCTQNDTTIHHLDLAIQAQNERTANRENRGVEGTSKE